MNNERELNIAGAGPAGMAAAIVLAKAGYHVRIFEQRPNVGGRFNDDYQGLENWSRDEDVINEVTAMGLEPNWWCRAFHGGILYDPELRPIQINSPRPLFYMLRRGSNIGTLDTALYNQARSVGVEFIFNQRIDTKDANIVATGPRGAPVAIAQGITFRLEHDDFACAILNDDMAPAGYVYFLVSDGQATLATVLFERFTEVHACLERSTQAITQLFGIKDFRNANYWGGYGLFSVPKSCERNGALWVGEAAGFQDLLFGFGIRSALVSGRLAAQSIIEGRSYDELWRARLLPHLKASVVSRAMYSKFGNLAKRSFWYLTGKNSRPNRFMHWLYNFSLIHKAVYPFIATNTLPSLRGEQLSDTQTSSLV